MASKARELANLGNAYSDGALSNRNLIINGAMQVAQRGASFSGLSNSPVFGIDRWSYRRSGTWSSLSGTFDQVLDAPDDFIYSLKYTVNTADTSTTGNGAGISQNFERYNVLQLAYGTSAAKDFTISFWVKSSVAGEYSFTAQASGTPSEKYTTTYDINSANVWEYKTITISGNTSTAIPDTDLNTIGLSIYWILGSGATTANLNTWQDLSGLVKATTSVDLTSTANATFQITGVQLEVGDTATPFEHRSYGQELALCQRYFTALDGATGSFAHIATGIMGVYNTTTQGLVRYFFPTEMRATPSMSYSALSDFDIEPFDVAPSSISSGGGTNKALALEVTDPSARTKGFAFMLTADVGGGYIRFDAEL